MHTTSRRRRRLSAHRTVWKGKILFGGQPPSTGIAESWVQGSLSRGFRDRVVVGSGVAAAASDATSTLPCPHTATASKYAHAPRASGAFRSYGTVFSAWSARARARRTCRCNYAGEAVATALWSVSAASSRNYAGAHKPGEPSDKARWRAHALSRAGKV